MFLNQRWNLVWLKNHQLLHHCRWRTLSFLNSVMVQVSRELLFSPMLALKLLNIEEGDYLALDLGGTNFRVILLRIKSGIVVSEEVQYYQVPEDVRLGAGADLFDFLASCIHNFMEDRGLKGKKLPLGFTFSFPMTQRGLNVGILVSWTKSFNCAGVVGEDAVKMLNDAIHRRGDMDVDVVAVLNDTTGRANTECMLIRI